MLSNREVVSITLESSGYGTGLMLMKIVVEKFLLPSHFFRSLLIPRCGRQQIGLLILSNELLH